MNHLRFTFYILLLTWTNFTFTLSAQIKQISEEEVNTQKLFIDATKEKILGNYESAIKLFEEVLNRDEENDVAAYELARIYHVMEEKDKALASIKSAVKIDSENQWYQLFLADMYEETNNPKAAEKIYDELIAKQPSDAFFYERLAFLLVKSKQPEKAVKVFDEMEKQFGIHEDIALRKHRLYLGMGDKKKAANEIERLISYMPSNTDYYHMLASFHQQMGDYDLADEVYHRILKIDPSDVKASLALARQDKSSGDDLSYLETLKPLFEQDDVNIDLKLKELIPYIQKVADGKTDTLLTTTIIELALTLEKVHPREAKSYAAIADLLFYSNDKNAALEKYKKALQLNKSIFSVYEQLMYIYLEQGDFKNMLSLSEEALDRFPNQAQAFYFNGLALGQLKRHKEAIASFNQSLLMSRSNPLLQIDIHNHLATEYFAIGQYDRSSQSFEKALEINPNDHMILNRYSAYLAERNTNLEKAKAMSALSNELAPNQAKYQDTYGWILYRMKEYKAAKDWISQALQNGGEEQAVILEHYGDVLFQLNETESAVSYWQKALQKGSDSVLLEKKIADRQIYEQ